MSSNGSAAGSTSPPVSSARRTWNGTSGWWRRNERATTRAEASIGFAAIVQAARSHTAARSYTVEAETSAAAAGLGTAMHRLPALLIGVLLAAAVGPAPAGAAGTGPA